MTTAFKMNEFKDNPPMLGQLIMASKDGKEFEPFCYESMKSRQDKAARHKYKYWKEIKE